MPNRVMVQNPAPTPAKYGLLSAATLVAASPSHWLNGVDFRADACAHGHAWPDPCANLPDPDEAFMVTFTGVDQHCTVASNMIIFPSQPNQQSDIYLDPLAFAWPPDPACAIGTPFTVQFDAEPPLALVAGDPEDQFRSFYLWAEDVAFGSTHTMTTVIMGQTFTHQFTTDPTFGVCINCHLPFPNPYTGTNVDADGTVNPSFADQDMEITFGPFGPQAYSTALPPIDVGTYTGAVALPITVEDSSSLETETGTFTIGALGCEPNCVETLVFGPGAEPGPFVPSEKEFSVSADFDHGDPFTLYHGLVCKILDVNEGFAAVAERFELAEPRALELAFWSGDPGQYPALATDPALVILGPADNIVDAVAFLEQQLGEVYGGVGVIHAPRTVMPYAADNNLIIKDGQTLRTPLGTAWAFGTGYDPAIAPVGEAAAGPGQTWIYATGQVTARHGNTLVVPQGGNAINRTTNETTVLAERTWLLTRDCFTAAILVTLSEEE